ncbi:DUF5995 family protein [Knoellia sp. CPCC 206435]|uniref:DUF5995 family protein n=1 Tax=Knoellia terrae TaxID=3404797 RepID=UPI003B4366DE
MSAANMEPTPTVATLISTMQHRLDTMPPGREHMVEFLSTYRRTTSAVRQAIRASAFEDPHWVETLVVHFAHFYLDALDADLEGVKHVTRPWRLAFDAPASSPPLIHVLLGINAHINYDLPQALLAVMPRHEFEDPVVVERRRRDHERIDDILSSRVAAEGHELGARVGRPLLDRALTPLHRRSARRLLREAREKVWLNTLELHRARSVGADCLSARVSELEMLSAARVANLRWPRLVLIRLSITGFGVTLPPTNDNQGVGVGT